MNWKETKPKIVWTDEQKSLNDKFEELSKKNDSKESNKINWNRPKKIISLNFEYKKYSKSETFNKDTKDEEIVLEEHEILIPQFTGSKTDIEFKLAKWKKVLEGMDLTDSYEKADQEFCFIAIENNIYLQFLDDGNVWADQDSCDKVKHIILYGRDPIYSREFDSKYE